MGTVFGHKMSDDVKHPYTRFIMYTQYMAVKGINKFAFYETSLVAPPVCCKSERQHEPSSLIDIRVYNICGALKMVFIVCISLLSVVKEREI